MKLAFTGTRNSMTRQQLELLAGALVHLQPSEFHHGDCTGADAQAHGLVRKLLPQCRIVVHPSTLSMQRAFCKGDDLRLIRPPLERNLRMVLECDKVLAAPATKFEVLRSGTWATVRYARKHNKLEAILPP